MTNDEFFSLFEQEIERLDKYFHKRILRSNIRSDIENLKQELINDTAIAVYEKLQNEKYKKYDVHKLIGLKARDTWLRYHEKWVKDMKIVAPPEEYSEVASGLDLIAQLERKELLESLQGLGSPSSWEMLMMHYDGMPYHEIADHFHLSEGSVKMRVSRLKEKFPLQKRPPQ